MLIFALEQELYILTMPTIFIFFGFRFLFYSNDHEPIHVHIAKGKPEKNATKIWITKSLHCVVCNNNSKIPSHVLNNILEIIENRAFEIVAKWQERFGTMNFYC